MSTVKIMSPIIESALYYVIVASVTLRAASLDGAPRHHE